MLRDGPNLKALDQSGPFAGEQPSRRNEGILTSHASTQRASTQVQQAPEYLRELRTPTPTTSRLILDPSSGLSDQRIRHFEKLLPDWVSEITLSRRSIGPKRRDRPPTRSARPPSSHSCLIAAIRLNRRPPVGAVQELQLALYSELGEWPFRHVISDFPHANTPSPAHKNRDTQLRREVLRTLPVGNELVHLEEFILSSKGANVRFLVAKIFSLSAPALSEWKRSFEQDHGLLVLIDSENAPPSWVDALRRAAGASGFLRPEAFPRLVNRLLAPSSLPSSVSDHRPRTPRTRVDLTTRNWFRVDSKECLIAEDILDIRSLPNGHTELLVGVVDIVSPGRPADIPNRRWRSFIVGEERNALVSRFEFDREYNLCGFSTQLARVKAHLKFTLSDLGKLLRSNSKDPFVKNLRRLDSIAAQLGNRRLRYDGFVEVSLGGSPGKLVFEPMVLFNSANTHWLRSNKVPLLYRVPQRVSIAERRDLHAELVKKNFSAQALERPDPLRTLLLLQQLDRAGESTLCHRILDGYVRSTRYSTEDDSHPGFASPYTGFKPKGGSGFNQLQLVRFLSGTKPLDEPTLRAQFVSLQGRGPLVAYSRTDQEALTSLAKLFQNPKEATLATVISTNPYSQPKERPHLTIRVEGWDRLALMQCRAKAHAEYLPGMQIYVRATGFDARKMCPVFEIA
jgi:hypothetical protein